MRRTISYPISTTKLLQVAVVLVEAAVLLHNLILTLHK
jgi:hypothetical protein